MRSSAPPVRKSSLHLSTRDDRLRRVLKRAQVEHVHLVGANDIKVVADVQSAVVLVPLRDRDLLAQREAVVRRIAVDKVAVLGRESDEIFAAVDQDGLVVIQRLAVVGINGLWTA